MRFRAKVVARLRDAGLSEQATRLLLPGSAGYPDEPDFAAIAAEAGFSFAIVQEGIPAPLVYGSEHGRVRMTVRRHSVADGAGHLSPHYDITSYQWRPVMAAAIPPRESAINATDNNVAVPMELDTTAGSITDADIKMPPDDYCLYHCFNYARSNGTARILKTVRSDYRKELLLAYVVTDYHARLHDY